MTTIEGEESIGEKTDPEVKTAVIHRFRAQFFFAWYDWWIGAYWDRSNRLLHICPLPMIGVKIVVPREIKKRALRSLKEARRHWGFVPLLVVMGIAAGIGIGVSLVRRASDPAPTFSPLPSAHVVTETARPTLGAAAEGTSPPEREVQPAATKAASTSLTTVSGDSSPSTRPLPSRRYDRDGISYDPAPTNPDVLGKRK